MVTSAAPNPDDRSQQDRQTGVPQLESYIGMEDAWPERRPSRRRSRRGYRKKQPRQIRVRGERLDPPDPVRLSKALIAAQRELEAAQAEAEAQTSAKRTSTDGPGRKERRDGQDT